jgi:hypothetical protein
MVLQNEVGGALRVGGSSEYFSFVAFERVDPVRKI